MAKKKLLRNLTRRQKVANRKAWIAALRSGGYEQGIGRLCYVTCGSKRYCCLGVACDVLLSRGYSVQIKQDGSTIRFNGDGGGLKPALMSAVGIDDDTQDACVGWNDEDGFSFKKIASLLEKLPIK